MKQVLLGALSLVIVGTALLIYSHITQTVAKPSNIPGFSVKLSAEANEVVDGFNRVCVEQNLSAMTPTALPMKMDVDADVYGIGPGPTFKLSDSSSYEFTFLQADGSLTQFSDDRLIDSLYDSHAPYYDKPDKPKWTEDQAIQVGKSFLNVLTQQIKIKLGEASARFDQKYQNSKYHVGEWMIWWPRVDSKGHIFSDDGVTIEIPEGHSPVLIQIKQTTLYSEEKGDPMTRAEALEKIQRKIADDKFWDNVKSIIPGHQSDGWTDPNPTNVYLQIVQPEHQKNTPSRLAWVFWFKQHSPYLTVDPPHPPVHTHYPISFWIDAYTGRFLGGDVVGLDTPD